MAWAGAVAAAELALAPRESPPSSEEEVFFEVVEGAVRVEGEVIREFAIRGERVTVAYKNTSREAVSPKYVLRVYNRYGIMLGFEEVSVGLLGGSPRLEPGDVGGDRIDVEWLDLEALLRHTTIRELPADFEQAKWISLAESNSEVGEGVDEAAGEE